MTLTVNYWLIKRVTPLLLIGLALGQDCTASDDTPGITLMGECYSIENTTAIDRSWENLPGTISPGIGLLTNLTYLGLFNNELTGGIPSEIWELKNIEFFRLENNQLINEIPENICELDFNWSKTTFFNISNNQFSPPYPECIKKYITIRIPPFVFNK